LVESGFVSEVFLSIQGEGRYLGVLQLFVRVAGCSLGCAYCDSAAAREQGEEFTVGDGGFVGRNPVDTGELAVMVEALLVHAPSVHSISITGGEPLEQPGFVAAFLKRCRAFGRPLYLETNGLHVEAAQRIVPLVDIISLDIKLPSLCGGGDLFSRYERILPLMRSKDFFCKVVLAEGFDAADFARAVDLVSHHDDRIPFIMQPSTPVNGCGTVDPGILLGLYREAASRLRDVRIIPQCHRILGLR
jgi:7-carboxy-7-deazaguanine synthase